MYDDNAILACQSHANVLNSKRIFKSEAQAAILSFDEQFLEPGLRVGSNIYSRYAWTAA